MIMRMTDIAMSVTAEKIFVIIANFYNAVNVE
jgi:hypothetical protein